VVALPLNPLPVTENTTQQLTGDHMRAFIVIAFILYWLPTVVALLRLHQIGSVMIVNLFLGWTVVGWIAALAMAVSDHQRNQQTVIIHQQPPQMPNPDRRTGRER
jgi:hypothetical protein